MDTRLAASLGAAARAARQRLGLTQADVAERVGISAEVYGRLERGGVLPSVETLRRLCIELEVSSDALLGLPTAVSGPGAGERPIQYRAPPELRRLERRLRALEPRQQRLLGILAAELGAGSRQR